MSYKAEWIVNLGPYEHVKLEVSDKEFERLHQASGLTLEEFLGDYHASLKAAVLYGRDQALLNARLAAGIEQAKAGETKNRGDFSHHLEDAPEMAHEGAVEALKEGLGATVLSEEEKPQDGPSGPSEEILEDKPKRPWDKKATTARKAAPKAAAKTETKSDWDF